MSLISDARSTAFFHRPVGRTWRPRAWPAARATAWTTPSMKRAMSAAGASWSPGPPSSRIVVLVVDLPSGLCHPVAPPAARLD